MESEHEEEITDEIETICSPLLSQKEDELHRLRNTLYQLKKGRHEDVFSESELVDQVCSN
jgi:hypothetical protein